MSEELLDAVVIRIPDLHEGQQRAWKTIKENRFTAIRCGRRWGKTNLAQTIAGNAAITGKTVGIFAPDYKRLTETYRETHDMLLPLVGSFSKDGVLIRLKSAGRIDFWTLEDDSAGRSRHYDYAFIDEAAFTKSNMMSIWEKSIKPTLFDRGGKCIVTSNTNGIDEENFFYQICNDAKYGFNQYHAPTSDNPLLPEIMPGEELGDWKVRRTAALQALIDDNPPLVYQQEHLADFVDFSGSAFFSRDKLLTNGKPVPTPKLCDYVFATLDSAVKDGQEHDSTAVCFWARSQHIGIPLVLVDWEIVQIEGASLEVWLPTVIKRLRELNEEIRCRLPSPGVFIEDKQTGTMLLQKFRNNPKMPCHAIASELTALGKDGRAINVSSFVWKEMVKISAYAFDKVTKHKGTSRNHLLSQIAGFKLGDKNAHKRADDLLDAFVYGVAVALGDNKGV